jgi:hypothetical protein
MEHLELTGMDKSEAIYQAKLQGFSYLYSEVDPDTKEKTYFFAK